VAVVLGVVVVPVAVVAVGVVTAAAVPPARLMARAARGFRAPCS